MNIAGIQKLTLLDYPGKVACIVFTKGCNFRCPYCHNASLVLSEAGENFEGKDIPMEESEIFSFLQKRRGVIDGVVITGGEPLLNESLPHFLEKIKSMGYSVKIDTNGSRPALLKKIVAEGLADKIAMDIKSGPGGYAKASGLRHLDFTAVDESKNFIMSMDRSKTSYEFRTTLVKGIHKMRDIIELSKWIAGAESYYLQQFKDSGNLIASAGLSAYDEREMNLFADAVRPYIPTVQVRGI